MIERVNVVSNAFRNVGYDHQRGVMEFEFHNGRRYQMRRFPHGLYRQFVNASSMGTFFSVNIRPFYQAIEVPPLPESEAADEEPTT